MIVLVQRTVMIKLVARHVRQFSTTKVGEKTDSCQVKRSVELSCQHTGKAEKKNRAR